MKYQRMENTTWMDHTFQELFSSVILKFCNLKLSNLGNLFIIEEFVLRSGWLTLELYKTDSDGKLNKEIDNEGTSLDKTKFFYKTADESEYRGKNTLFTFNISS